MDNHREGIQAEKPISTDDQHEGIQAEKPIPPWERPGCFRRDCEPHRGNFLWWLAFAGLILGILALAPEYGWMPGLIGIFLGLCSRYMAKTDLAKMQAGLMDPFGRAVTGSAEDFSNAGLVLSVIGTVFWGGVVLLRW